MESEPVLTGEPRESAWEIIVGPRLAGWLLSAGPMRVRGADEGVLPGAGVDDAHCGRHPVLPFILVVQSGIGERVGIGEGGFEHRPSAGDEVCPEVLERIVAASSVDHIRSAPKAPVVRLVHVGGVLTLEGQEIVVRKGVQRVMQSAW